MWEPALEWASIRGYPSYALDLPGFGRSKAARDFLEIIDMETAARTVLDCLDALGLQQAVLVGCSMGGYVIFAMLRLRPLVAKGLLLSDTRASADTEEARAARFRAIETIKLGGRHEFLESMLQRLLSSGRSRTDDVARWVAKIMNDQEDETLVAALHGLAQRRDSTGLLGSIRVPTAVVVGDSDALVSVEEARALAESIPSATLTVIAGAGHLPNLEAPEAFHQALGSLLARVEKRSS